MTESVILKGIPDPLGRRTVTIRLADGKKRKFKATRLRVLPEQLKDGKIVGHPQAVQYNRVIERAVADFLKSQKAVPDATITDDFYAYARQCFLKWTVKGQKQQSTITQYESKMRMIRQWFPEVRLTAIDKQWCERLHFKLLREGKNNNTIWNYFKTVAVILTQAVDDHLLVRNEVAHYNDKPAYQDPDKNYLGLHQIRDLERYAAVATPERRHATLWFLIGCYTGLRHSDMVTFNKERNIIDGRLVKTLVKTKTKVSLPVEGKIRELLEQVDYQPLRVQNQPFNRMMKEVAKDCGIEQNITCHTSRHSAGMMLADAGVSIEIAAAILGHRDTKHTKIYYHLTNKRVDAELGKILGKK